MSEPTKLKLTCCSEFLVGKCQLSVFILKRMSFQCVPQFRFYIKTGFLIFSDLLTCFQVAGNKEFLFFIFVAVVVLNVRWFLNRV